MESSREEVPDNPPPMTGEYKLESNKIFEELSCIQPNEQPPKRQENYSERSEESCESQEFESGSYENESYETDSYETDSEDNE